MQDKLIESEVCFPDVELKVVKSEKKEILDSKDPSILQQCNSGQTDNPDEKKPKKRGRKKKSDVKKEEGAVSNFNTQGCDSSAVDVKPPALHQNFYRPYACDRIIKQENDPDSHCQGQQPLTHSQGPAGQPYGQNMMVPYSQVQANCNSNPATNSYNQFQNDNNMALQSAKDNCYSQYQNVVSTAAPLPAQYPGTQQMPNSLYQPYLPNPSQFQQLSRFSFQTANDPSLPPQSVQGSGFVDNQIAVKTENTNFQASMKSCSMYSSSQGVAHSQLSSSMTSSMAFSIGQNQSIANSEYSSSSYSTSQSYANSTDMSGNASTSFNGQNSGSDADSSSQIQCTTSAFTPYSQTGMSNFITQSNAIISVKCEPTDFGYGGVCHYDAADG